MLIGDLVQDIREAVTDQPQVLSVPTLVQPVAVNVLGALVPPATYFIVLTALTPWGETSASNEFSVTVAGPNNAIQIPFVPPLGSAGTLFRAYIGFASGQQAFYVPFSDPGFTSSFTMTNIAPTTAVGGASLPGQPPSRNSAYLPDSNGDAINVNSLFRWINRGLELASQVAGGLLDYSGVGTKSGVPQYIILGQYKKISTVWYDGYPLAMDDAGNYFRRNTITASILASVATSLLTDRMMIEVWPQPSRSGAVTTLAAPLAATDSSAILTSVAGFLLTDGFVNFNGEICSYNGIVGNILTNLIRGLGGTVAAAQAAGTPVTELNIFFQGWKKYAPNFQPGQANVVLPVPVDWNAALFKYGLGRAKLAEQNVDDFVKLEQDLIKTISDWSRTNKITTGPRQIGEVTNSLEVIPSFGGGWVVP